MGASLKWILGIGINYIREHEEKLVSRFLEGVETINGLVVYGPRMLKSRHPLYLLLWKVKIPQMSEVHWISNIILLVVPACIVPLMHTGHWELLSKN